VKSFLGGTVAVSSITSHMFSHGSFHYMIFIAHSVTSCYHLPQQNLLNYSWSLYFAAPSLWHGLVGKLMTAIEPEAVSWLCTLMKWPAIEYHLWYNLTIKKDYW